jgi:hypothetical protein
MAAYINDRKQIAFVHGWPVLRGDVYDGGVGFDVTGLCLLDADECRELAAWLIAAAEVPASDAFRAWAALPAEGDA